MDSFSYFSILGFTGIPVPLPASDFTWPDGNTTADWYAALLCTLPFDWVLLWLVLLLRCRGVREVVLGGLLSIDYLVIVVLQNSFQEPRPKGSCLTSCGMPSGHAVLCVSLMCWISAELAQRLPSPRSLVLILLVVALHLPVTWAKVHLRDHTEKQVLCGALVGACLGFGYFRLLRKCHLGLAAWLCQKGLVDNYEGKEDYIPLAG
eukprot:symbB.v1.2.002433.t1/scaffold129.1/size311234/22